MCFVGESPNPILNARGHVVRMPLVCCELKAYSHKELIARVRMLDTPLIASFAIVESRVKCSRQGDLTDALHHMKSTIAKDSVLSTNPN